MKKILSVIIGIALAGTMLPSFANDKCADAITFATTDAQTHTQRTKATCGIVWDLVVTKNCTINSTGAITTNLDGSATTASGKTKASTCL